MSPLRSRGARPGWRFHSSQITRPVAGSSPLLLGELSSRSPQSLSVASCVAGVELRACAGLLTARRWASEQADGRLDGDRCLT